MKTLAIDFGERRIGIAVSDADGILAMPLETLVRRSDAQVISEIAAIVARENIESLVVGEPRRLDGSRGDMARRAASFARKIAARTALPYVLVNESLTSHEAKRRLEEAGVNTRRNPERIDAVAAQILLEEALGLRRGRQL